MMDAHPLCECVLNHSVEQQVNRSTASTGRLDLDYYLRESNKKDTTNSQNTKKNFFTVNKKSPNPTVRTVYDKCLLNRILHRRDVYK